MKPTYDPKLQDEIEERIARVLCAERGEYADNWRGHLAAARNVIYSLATAELQIGGIKLVEIKRDAPAYPMCGCFRGAER